MGNSHAIWVHTVLPATRQRCEFRLYPQPKQVLDLATPGVCGIVRDAVDAKQEHACCSQWAEHVIRVTMRLLQNNHVLIVSEPTCVKYDMFMRYIRLHCFTMDLNCSRIVLQFMASINCIMSIVSTPPNKLQFGSSDTCSMYEQ